MPMEKPTIYRAFGLLIESPFPIAQAVPVETAAKADVTIACRDLSCHPCMPEEGICVREEGACLSIPEVARFYITGGDRIDVDPVPGYDPALLDVYIMGSCMGTILHQRGLFLLHGSCVTDGERAILIIGDSGAGKSTLAAEFIAQGWWLMTDDVAAMEGIGQTPMVRASYPAQRLWADAVACYGGNGADIRSLYTEGEREKFGLNASKHFQDGKCPVHLILRLLPGELPKQIRPIEGMAKVDQLMRNTYRPYMVSPSARQTHFRRCVTLASQVPMALLLRDLNGQYAKESYEMIINYLGEL